MKILILLTVALAIGCSKKSNENSWIAPKVHIVRNDQKESKALTSNDVLDVKDEVYFSTKNLDISKPTSDTDVVLITSNVTCEKNGKSFNSKYSAEKTHIQLKEIVPLQAFVADANLHIKCNVELTIQNSLGSTKKYDLGQKTISLASEDDNWSLKSKISYQEFMTTDILNVKTDDQVELACDLLYSKTIAKSDSLNLLELVSYSNNPLTKKYQPHQICRIASKSADGAIWSKPFEIQFQKVQALVEKLQHSHYVPGMGIIIYNWKFENPYDFPISFALDKSKLVITTKSIYNDSTTQYNADVHFSDNRYIEKGSLYVIHLEPGQNVTVMMSVFRGCHCTSHPVTEKEHPFYNLERNYESIEEINAATEVKTLDRMVVE